MSFPLSAKHPILREEFEKSDTKTSKKIRLGNGFLPKGRPVHHHPEQISRTSLKIPKLSSEVLFRDKPLETQPSNNQNEKFYLTKKQVENFVATHNLMQKLQQNVSSKADESAHNHPKSSVTLRSKGTIDGPSSPLQSPAAFRDGARIKKLRVSTEGNSSIGDLTVEQVRTSKTQTTPLKLQPIILPNIGAQSAITNSFISPRALEGASSFEFNRSQALKPMSRMDEFIATQKCKILGKDYTKLQKIQGILTKQHRVLAQASDSKQKLGAITLDLPIERSHTQKSDDLETYQRQTALKENITSTVNDLTSAMGLIGYDSLRDEHNFTGSNKIESHYISSPLALQLNQLQTSKFAKLGTDQDTERLLNIKHSIENKFQLIDTSVTKVMSKSRHVHTQSVNQSSTKPKPEKVSETQQSSPLKTRSEQKKEPLKEDFSRGFDAEFEQLTKKMSLAKKDNRKLRKIFRSKKRVLNKNFNSLDHKVDKLVI